MSSRYKKGKEIGKGAFARVYIGTDTKEGSKVAIKTILAKKSEHGIDWTALREVKVLFEIVHKNVVRLVGVYAEGGNLNLVMEFCPLDLEKIIRSEVTLTEPDIKSYIRMALLGIQACHDCFVLHRDIKPGNLLIGLDRQLKVADFGLAKVFGDPDPNDTDEVVTLPYRAHELLFGAKMYSTAIDVWAIGCTLAELFIREIFLPGTDEMDQLGKIYYTFGTPKESDWINMKALNKAVEFTPCKAYPLKKRFPAVSSQGIDLIKKMMEYDPNKRISIPDALKHSFLKGDLTDVKDLPYDNVLKKKESKST